MQPPFFVELDTPATLIESRFALHTKHRVMSGFFILGASPVRLHGRKIGDVLHYRLHALAPVNLLGRGLRLQARLIARRAVIRAQQLRSNHRAHECIEVRRTTQGGRGGRMVIGFQASRGRDHVCGRTQGAKDPRCQAQSQLIAPPLLQRPYSAVPSTVCPECGRSLVCC
jgi:hypothetical protein